MARAVLRLAYTSVLRAVDEDDAQRQLAAIFSQSARNNPSKSIGGILYFNPLTFSVMQILEGPTDEVEALFETIRADTRHKDARQISRELVDERRYPQFGMKSGVQGEWLEDQADRDATPNWTKLAGQTELLRLTYSSVLTAEEEDVDSTIECILKQSVKNNPAAQIGGALLFNRKTLQLLQVLEGPAAAVRQLYERIAIDKRHELCNKLSEELVKTRTYDDWGMQLSGECELSSLTTPAWVKGSTYDWENLEGGLSQSFKRPASVGPRRPGKRVQPSALSVLGESPPGSSPSVSVLGAVPPSDPSGTVLGYKVLVPDCCRENSTGGPLPVDASGRVVRSGGNRRTRGGFGCCMGGGVDDAVEPYVVRR